jgi:hypothetical protein
MAEQGPAVSATEPEIIALKNPVKDRDRGRDAYCYAPTGWPEVVTHLRLPQNPACRFPALGPSDATIMSLAGHLSRKMMERSSHTRNEAKRQAIAVLDR